MRLERRRPRLHECEARKGSRDLRPAKFDVAEKRDVAGGDACVPVASAGQTDIENTSLDRCTKVRFLIPFHRHAASLELSVSRDPTASNMSLLAEPGTASTREHSEKTLTSPAQKEYKTFIACLTSPIERPLSDNTKSGLATFSVTRHSIGSCSYLDRA